MAPKKEPKPDKAKVAAKQKAMDDKTFGLKNKNKSTKVQQYVKTLHQSVTANMKAAPAKDKKRTEEEKARELAELFNLAIKQPKVPLGVDPKSILCAFFKHGQCTKGTKCKFSHDLNIERKVAKIDLFTDQRELKKDEEGEGGMEDWDQEMLEKAIFEKHQRENQNKPTDIACRHFLDAVERKLYGWFWKCPNGAECKYRHALPPGYVLKSQMKELLEEEAKNAKDVTEVIEEERAKVDAKTPITEEVFKAWRTGKVETKRRREQEELEQRRKKGLLTGREIFMQEGFIAEDDASAADEYRTEEDVEGKIKEMLATAAAAADTARLRAEEDRANGIVFNPKISEEDEDEEEEEVEEEEEETEEEDGEELAESRPEAAESSAAESSAAPAATTLQLGDDEAALFGDGDDDDEDLDDEELEDEEGLEDE